MSPSARECERRAGGDRAPVDFSIVTPSFRQPQWLRLCLASVADQAGVTYEHIVQDCDSGADVAAACRDVRGVRLFQERDTGMYEAINRGWARATGEIFSWLNCDEQYLPGTLARVAAIFQQHPEIDFLFGDSVIVDRGGLPLAARREIPLRAAYLSNSFLYALSCSTFFRRRLWDDGLLRLDTRYRYAADYDMILRLLGQGREALHVGAYMGVFCAHDENLSVRKMAEMARESEVIRTHHGALPAWLRPSVRLLRCLERLIRGCYRTDTLAYNVWMGSPPSVRRVGPCRVGWRFTYSRSRRTASHRQRGSPC